jgi:hypothetical protein
MGRGQSRRGEPLGLVIVTGQPRSGTSLMMRVLRDSGFPVIMDQYGSFEETRTIKLKEENAWVADLPDRSTLKVLFPHLLHIPLEDREGKPIPYSFIWMTRNPHQQARSQRRVANQTKKWERARHKLIISTERGIPQYYETIGPLHKVSFDALVTDPKLVGKDLGDFLGVESLNYTCVYQRDPKCSLKPQGYYEDTSGSHTRVPEGWSIIPPIPGVVAEGV